MSLMISGFDRFFVVLGDSRVSQWTSPFPSHVSMAIIKANVLLIGMHEPLWNSFLETLFQRRSKIFLTTRQANDFVLDLVTPNP